MSIAIHTKYTPSTSTRGNRITATARRINRTERVSIPYPHDLSGVDCYAAAAKALAEKLTFTRDWSDHTLRYCGETLDGKGYVFSVGASLEA